MPLKGGIVLKSKNQMDYSKVMRYTDKNSTIVKAVQVTVENEEDCTLTEFIGKKKMSNSGIFRYGAFLIDKGEYVEAMERSKFLTTYKPICDAGCLHFHGGEINHFETCPYYPDSLTELNADLIASFEARIKALCDLADARKEAALRALDFIERYANLMENSPLLQMANEVKKALEA